MATAPCVNREPPALQEPPAWREASYNLDARRVVVEYTAAAERWFTIRVAIMSWSTTLRLCLILMTLALTPTSALLAYYLLIHH